MPSPRARRLPSPAALLVAACISDDQAEEANAPHAIVHAYCDLAERCSCPDLDDPASLCVPGGDGLFAREFVEARELGLTYDPQCVDTWIEDYERSECSTPQPEAPTPPLCGACKPYHGDKRAGEACEFPDELLFDDCAPELRCAGGTCVDPCVAAELGEPCFFLDCVPGSECVTSVAEDFLGIDSECVATVGEGESCAVSPCAPPLECRYDELCHRLPELGEPCENACVDGAWCGPSPGQEGYVCVVPASDGEPCGDDEACLGRCDDETWTCTAASPDVCI